MNRANRIAFPHPFVASNLFKVCLIVLVLSVVPCNATFAADKIKCVVDDFHYGIWMIETPEQGKAGQTKAKQKKAEKSKEQSEAEQPKVDQTNASAEQPTDPEVADKPVLKAIGKDLSKALDNTGKYEVETRDKADLAPGEKFKAADVLVLAELSCTGTTPAKQSTISIDARLVRTSNSEIVDAVHSREMIQGAVNWPKSLAEYTSEDFQKSATGRALQASLNHIATELSQKATSISNRLKPPPTK